MNNLHSAIVALHLAAAVLLLSSAQAEETPALVATEDAALEELLAIIDEETTVATKTKLNSDYVPGMVTILQGEELQALGVRNAWQALTLVPGLQTYRDFRGDPYVTVRGLPFPFNAGNIQVLVNSVAMSREASGVNSAVLLLPIEQIQRIEFVRGPGSALYGDFAFMGLVNIVTRTQDQRATVSVDDSDGHLVALQFQHRNDANRFALTGNLARLRDDDAYSPLDRDAEEAMQTGLFTLNYRDTEIKAQLFDRQYDSTSDKEERHQVIEASHVWALSDASQTSLKLAYLDNDSEQSNTLFRGSQWSVRSDWDWRANDTHQLLLSLSFLRSHIDHALQIRMPPPGQPAPRTEVFAFDLQASSVVVQDQIHLTDALTVTAGVSFDRRDDIDAQRLTPRLGAVWQMQEHHLVKVQYAEGFRGPSFFEFEGARSRGRTLDYEVNRSTEASYIYRDDRNVARLTWFHVQLDDMIFTRPIATPGQPPRPTFVNDAAGKSEGWEAEWEQQLSDSLKWSANLSYADAVDTRRDSQEWYAPDGSAEWLANIGLWYRPWHHLLVTVHGYAVGDRVTGIGSTSGGYDVYDATVSLLNWWPQWTLRAGVKDASDTEPSYVLGGRAGAVIQQYPGRAWWLQASYDF